jgi:hypothetical protein
MLFKVTERSNDLPASSPEQSLLGSLGMWRRAKAVGLAALLFRLLGCAEEQYISRPTEQATASVNGLAAARYPIPPERPVGTVLVASSGVTDVTIENRKTRALYVRMVVANNSDPTPWTVDTREQILLLPGQGQSRPAFVNTEGGQPPVIEVASAQKRSLDLYYPLPSTMQSNTEVAEFELLWTVRTGARPVTERTPFDRLRIQPQYAGDASSGFTLGAAPYWWYDPFWPRATFIHPTVIVVPRQPAQPYVAPPAR